jgi:hypothetical protein
MLDLVGVQEVRWDGGGTEPAGEHTSGPILKCHIGHCIYLYFAVSWSV